jgi:hypothetical protein
MTDETAQRRWQRILAEYAIARAEHRIACSVLTARPHVFGEPQSAESLPEQKARGKLLNLRDQMSELEADFWLVPPAQVAIDD